MGKKYKVSQNGQYFGHYSAHSYEEAIAKAIEKQGEYYKIDKTQPFDVKYGMSWVNVAI